MKLLLDQNVSIHWGKRSKELYESDKYPFTKWNDVFEINVKDLSPGSGAEVTVLCDVCKKNTYKCVYHNYTKTLKEVKDTDDICPKCVDYFIKNKPECFKLIIEGNLKSAPKGCSNSFSDDDIKQILVYLFEEMRKNNEIISIEELKKKINKKLLSKYGLRSILRERTVFNIVQTLFPECNEWEIGTAPCDFWKNSSNIERVRLWVVNKLYNDYKILDINEIKNINISDLFIEWGLVFLYFSIFKGSRFKVIDWLFPNIYLEWEFPVPNNYYKDEQNIKKVMEWFINRLKDDGIIDSLDDIPKKVSLEVFQKYNIRALIVGQFSSSPYKCFNFIYPDKWMPWEFNCVPDGYWSNSKNIESALNWFINKLIENGHINNIKDLVGVNLRGLLKEYGLSTFNNNKYFKNCYSIFANTFPEIFSEEDFLGCRIALDKTILDSKEEVLIHNYLKNNYDDVKYYDNNKSKKYKWHNEKYDEYYVADWILNGNIIIEYFGCYTPKSKHPKFIEYNKKTLRKIEYFSSLSGYRFIYMFPEDLRNNLYGLKNKLKSIVSEEAI